MNVRHIVLTCAGMLALAGCTQTSAGPGHLPSCGALGTQVSLAVAAYSRVDPTSDSGCVIFPANPSTTDTAEYLVLPWSVGGALGATAAFTLESSTPLPSSIASSVGSSMVSSTRPANVRGPIAIQFDHFLRGLAQSRQYGTAMRAAAAVATPRGPTPSPAGPPTVGDKRTFKVCSNLKCDKFDNVGGVARTVGTHVAIYVDTLAPSPGLGQAALDSIRSIFDTRLYPLDTATFGGVSDIDGNSVVIVLMTGTVNKLVSKAECNASGGAFVAGFFFSADIDPDPDIASQFNNGEIFYSIVADPGATLSCAHNATQVETGTPVTFVHEFQHMINFVQHVRVRSAEPEETWLDEGMARYAEEVAGRSFLASGDSDAFRDYAIDPVYDAYHYMLSPGNAALLFARDTGGLEPLGAGWLFVRFIVDQFGDSLPRRLAESSLGGAANVSSRTGEDFAQTITHWSLANWVSDLPGFAAPAELKYTSWHFRVTFGSLHSQSAHDFPLAYPLVPAVSAAGAVQLNGRLLAGSGYYQRVKQPPGAAAFTLRFSDPNGAGVSPAVVPRLNVLRIR